MWVSESGKRDKLYLAVGKITVFCIFSILLAIFAFVFVTADLYAARFFVDRDYSSRVYPKYVVEAGNVSITAEDFQKNEALPVRFAEGYDPNLINTRKPGKYPVKLISGLYRYDTELIVEDTVAPTAEPVDVKIEYGESVNPEDLVRNINDAGKTTVRFAHEPDLSTGGERQIEVIVEDEAGNFITLKPTVTVVAVKKEVVMEAGGELPSVEAFLTGRATSGAGEEAVLVTDIASLDNARIGDYPVRLRMGEEVYDSVLKIRDTIPPQITVRDYEGYTTSKIIPGFFMQRIIDATDVSLSFAESTDLTHPGKRSVTVIATDAGGNKTEAVAQMTLVADTDPPVIKGIKDITSIKGRAISYKNGVSVSDNADKDIKLVVDQSAVNTKVVGTYPVIYSAVDKAGNAARQTISVTIIDEGYNAASVYAMANQILAGIITPGMSSYSKVSAINWWVKKNVSYAEVNIQNDWVRGAYYGFTKHKGDCYIHAVTSKALFDCAGIRNMIIDSLPLRYIHYWNLVDIGEGWKHCDSTPRRDKAVILYMDDASLTAFSMTHKNSHIYDRTRFPGIK